MLFGSSCIFNITKLRRQLLSFFCFALCRKWRCDRTRSLGMFFFLELIAILFVLEVIRFRRRLMDLSTIIQILPLSLAFNFFTLGHYLQMDDLNYELFNYLFKFVDQLYFNNNNLIIFTMGQNIDFQIRLDQIFDTHPNIRNIKA